MDSYEQRKGETSVRTGEVREGTEDSSKTSGPDYTPSLFPGDVGTLPLYLLRRVVGDSLYVWTRV